MKIFFVVFSFLFCFTASAQKLRVGLYTAANVKEFQFSVGSGSYLLYAVLPDGTIHSSKLNALSQGKFKVNGTMIQYYQGGTYRFQASQFELLQLAHEDFCSWSVPALSTKTRSYEGDFEVRVNKANLQLVNLIEL